MVKVLIYSSREIYDKAPYEGRAEADFIAYRDGDYYYILKDRTSKKPRVERRVFDFMLSSMIELAERNEWPQEKDG